MTKLCGVMVYIAIYDQAVCGVIYDQVYIAIYDQAVWCDGVYCYL